jgi:enoyl-CoA hydratase
MPGDPIEVADRERGVRVLTLNRPPANALNDELLDRLADAVDAAADDPEVRAVVLRATGSFFSGGFDLRAPRREGDAVTDMVVRYRESHRKLLALPKPTVAAIEGHAVAGGLVLALACDHRVAVEGDYRIGLNESAIGAAFPPVAMEIVRLRLTHAATVELILGAEMHHAADLARFGVVGGLTPRDDFEGQVFGLAERLGGYPREAYAHAKRELVADAVSRLERVPVDRELEIAALWSTGESRAARAAQRNRLS